MPSVNRILDANANRVREALRVMEEAARFILDDAKLTASIKNIRHDLAAAMGTLRGLENWRDTPGDVGTEISTSSEMQRSGVYGVVVAAGKRLSEGFRSIEEYGKTLPAHDPGRPGFAASIESLRYRGYHVEQQLLRQLATGRACQWRLCVLISEDLCHGSNWFAVASSLAALGDKGPDCIQLREKFIDGGELLKRARRLVELCRPRGIAVILNDRPDIALLADADGVHLGQGDLPLLEARKIAGTQLLIGISTSSLDEAQTAIADGADYCGVGPMFSTSTKKKDHIVGPAYLKAYVERFPKTPHLAIGGIRAENLREILSVGGKGIAVSSAVCSASDPAAACLALTTQLP